MDSPQIRIALYKNVQSPSAPKNVLVSAHITKPQMLAMCSDALGIGAKKIFNETGVALNSFEGLTDGAVLYVSQGENFQVKRPSISDTRASRRCMFAMLGAAAVGKSAITLRYVSNKFVKDYDPTIEDFYAKTVQIDNEATQISILDTAGMEDYESLIDHWIEKKDAFILVYSVQLPETMQRLRDFHAKIQHHYEMKDPTKSPVVVMAANKIDVADRYVSTEQGQQFAMELGVQYFEVSAQSNTNIEEMFAHIVRELRSKRQPVAKPKGNWWSKCSLL
jgi:GTPase KRas protein